jgi:hypothetical protein
MATYNVNIDEVKFGDLGRKCSDYAALDGMNGLQNILPCLA